MLAVNDVVEVRVPDIGDYKDVPIIDILVKPGDAVKAEDPLITVESDKASMDVPAPVAGVVRNVQVKVGDKVSQGSVILTIDGVASSNGVRNGAVKGTLPATPAEQERPPVQATLPIAQPAARQPSQSTIELRVPDIGDFKDVPVIEVLVKVGDVVAVNDPVITVESDKASMDVPSSVAGVVQNLALKLGDKISQGSLIATIATSALSAAVAQPAAEPPSSQSPKAAQAARSAPVASVSASAAHAGPGVRRLARELGVTLSHVQGTASHGRVTKEDVQNFVKRALQGLPVSSAAPVAAATGGLTVAPWPKVDFAKYGEIEVKPLSRIKKISGSNLHRNWVMIPHVTNNEEADITDIEAFRKDVNAQKTDAKLTILAFLIKAVVCALKKFPEFNASLDGEDLVYKQYYHIGFAADTPNGLVVPIVRDADKKGVLEIARETRDLAAKARDGKLMSLEMQGGTFTISSLGGIGGTTFTPIINAPEVAILGACRSTMRPVWDGKQFAPRLMLPLSLSYDHRVIDGAAAARFNAYLAEVLADMRKVML
jgi:pyruvate dehydrogenase E2 component (dihydrolipoamide acetyltransferase)